MIIGDTKKDLALKKGSVLFWRGSKTWWGRLIDRVIAGDSVHVAVVVDNPYIGAHTGTVNVEIIDAHPRTGIAHRTISIPSKDSGSYFFRAPPYAQVGLSVASHAESLLIRAGDKQYKYSLVALGMAGWNQLVYKYNWIPNAFAVTKYPDDTGFICTRLVADALQDAGVVNRPFVSQPDLIDVALANRGGWKRGNRVEAG